MFKLCPSFAVINLSQQSLLLINSTFCCILQPQNSSVQFNMRTNFVEIIFLEKIPMEIFVDIFADVSEFMKNAFF